MGLLGVSYCSAPELDVCSLHLRKTLDLLVKNKHNKPRVFFWLWTFFESCSGQFRPKGNITQFPRRCHSSRSWSTTPIAVWCMLHISRQYCGLTKITVLFTNFANSNQNSKLAKFLQKKAWFTGWGPQSIAFSCQSCRGNKNGSNITNYSIFIWGL